MGYNKYAIPLLCITSLVGCSTSKPYLGYYGKEAGSVITNDQYGLATANNVAVQTGDLTGTMIANLTRKFTNEVPTRINFASNSAALDGAAQAALRQQANWIKRHSQIVFRIYGHTDKVGSPAYNKRLGLRRAKAALNFLVSQGVSRSKLQAVSSFGETQPLVLTEDDNRENRRTVTEVSGFAKLGEGTELDGKYAKTVYDKYISGNAEADSE